MNDIDCSVLDHCRGDFRRLKPLRARIASGTLYRHADRLLALGWLERRGALYRTTEAGARQLAEAAAKRRWDVLDTFYRPLALVPSALHHALIVLIVAACVCRQHETRPDRHPYFVLYGGTLKWKTSLAIFVSYMLGLDPALVIADCAAEVGKSLWVRRGASGGLVFRREILSGAFLTLDDFSSAETSVRNAIGILLSGRLVMPVENERVTIRAVPLLTLNPRPRATLEEQLGLSAPQIRRGVLANVDAVALPDLAVTGERAIVAARTATPIQLTAPTLDCGAHHRAIIDLVRTVIRPEAHERVDVEVVVNLCTGITAFIREPDEAVAQVLHALGVVAESLGWTRSGWVDPVAAFSLDATPGSAVVEVRALALPARGVTAPGEAQAHAQASQVVSLEVPRTPRRDDIVPDLALDPALKARLVWFAVQSGLPVRVALTRLLNFYLFWLRNKATVDTLWAILKLAEALGIARLTCDAVHGYLVAKAQLVKYACTFEDVPEALKLLDLLAELPANWTWDQARTAIQGVAKILVAGIDAQQIDAFLDRHQRLIKYGFDEALAEAVARLLTKTGATGTRRARVIRALVGTAGTTVDRDALEEQCQQRQQEIAQLEAARNALEGHVNALKARVANLQAAAAAALREKQRLDAECQVQRTDLDVIRGLRALIFGRIEEIGPFLDDVDRMRQWHRQGRVPDATYATLVGDVRAKVLEFFRQIVAEAQAREPDSATS